MTSSVRAIDTIISDPDIRSGRPIIAGTSIRVQDLVASHIYRELSLDDLAQNFMLDIGQVYAALAWYYLNKDEIDNQMEADEQLAERMLIELEAEGKILHLE